MFGMLTAPQTITMTVTALAPVLSLDHIRGSLDSPNNNTTTMATMADMANTIHARILNHAHSSVDAVTAVK